MLLDAQKHSFITQALLWRPPQCCMTPSNSPGGILSVRVQGLTVCHPQARRRHATVPTQWKPMHLHSLRVRQRRKDVKEGKRQKPPEAEPKTRVWVQGNFWELIPGNSTWGAREGKGASCQTESLMLTPLGSSERQGTASPPRWGWRWVIYRAPDVSYWVRACEWPGTSCLP